MKNSTLRMAWIIEDKLKALYYDGLFASINKKDIVWNTLTDQGKRIIN